MVRQESAKLLCVGSIPTLASKSNCPGDGIGRRNGLKIRGLKSRVGSSPTPGTKYRKTKYRECNRYLLKKKPPLGLYLIPIPKGAERVSRSKQSTNQPPL